MELSTLADVRELIGHLPIAVRKRDSWRYVAKQLDEAARGGDILDLEVSLWIVLTLESIESRRLR
jgi:hypothetical protein